MLAGGTPGSRTMRYELHGEEDYTLHCAGQDGKFGSDDDIVSESGSIRHP